MDHLCFSAPHFSFTTGLEVLWDAVVGLQSYPVKNKSLKKNVIVVNIHLILSFNTDKHTCRSSCSSRICRRLYLNLSITALICSSSCRFSSISSPAFTNISCVPVQGNIIKEITKKELNGSYYISNRAVLTQFFFPVMFLSFSVTHISHLISFSLLPIEAPLLYSTM